MSLDGDQYIAQLLKALQSTADHTTISSASDYVRNLQPANIDGESIGSLRDLLEKLSQHQHSSQHIDMLYAAIQHYPRNSLTPFHPFLVRSCCSSREYSAAIPLISQNIESLPKEHHLIYSDHLLYHFYGALCHAALRDLPQAILFLSLTLAAGGNNTSLIQVDAYRKYVLLGLIEHGKLLPFPKTVSANARRSLETLAAEYIEIAEQYSTSSDNFLQSSKTHAAIVKSHGNEGLLNTAIASLPSHKILRLKRVYSSIELTDLADRIGRTPSETNQLLETMNREGRLISTTDVGGIVDFPTSAFEPDAQLKRLAQVYQSIDDISARMSAQQRTLELDPAYVEKHLGRGSGMGDGPKGKRKGKSPRQPSGSTLTGQVMEESDDSMSYHT